MKYAYHFTDGKLRNGDPVPNVGEWLEHTGDVKICESGLHASWHPFDALQYAPGNHLYLVEVEDIVDKHGDKFVCRRRKIVKTIDAESLLREFARKCALSVVHLWDAPEVVVRYLKTGDEMLRDTATDDAAWDTATDDATRYAASAAAWYAARVAARVAARDAARDAARAAAWYAARVATRYAASAAAWYAASDAASAEARKNQRAGFKRMVNKAFKEANDER